MTTPTSPPADVGGGVVKCRFVGRDGFERWLDVSGDLPPRWQLAAPNRFPVGAFISDNAPGPAASEIRDFIRMNELSADGGHLTGSIYVEDGNMSYDHELGPSQKTISDLTSMLRVVYDDMRDLFAGRDFDAINSLERRFRQIGRLLAALPPPPPPTGAA